VHRISGHVPLGDHRLTVVITSVERHWRYQEGWVSRSYGTRESIALSTGQVLQVDALYLGIWDVEGE
jgi:hypothetical protein